MSATWHCDRCPMPTIFASPFRRKTARATRAVENKLIDQQMRKYFDKLSINRQHRTSRVVVQQPSTAASGKQLTAATQHQAYNNSQLLTKSRRVPFAKIRPQALPILVQHKKKIHLISLSLSLDCFWRVWFLSRFVSNYDTRDSNQLPSSFRHLFLKLTALEQREAHLRNAVTFFRLSRL